MAKKATERDLRRLVSELDCKHNIYIDHCSWGCKVKGITFDDRTVSQVFEDWRASGMAEVLIEEVVEEAEKRSNRKKLVTKTVKVTGAIAGLGVLLAAAKLSIEAGKIIIRLYKGSKEPDPPKQ